MIDFESKLKQLFKYNNSPPILFVGSGLSRRYLQLPDWEGLLLNMAKIVRNDDYAYDYYENKAVLSKSKINKCTKIAELIEKDLSDIWYTDNKFENSRIDYGESLKKGATPLKIEIAKFIKDNSNLLIDKYGSEIEWFSKIGDNSLAGIITTNYDSFLEEHLKNYPRYIGQEELIFSKLEGIGEIYKIHGCISAPESIIINEEDYIKFDDNQAYLSAKILTMFLEYPVIFIGYSIEDTNIKKILKSIIKCLSEENLNKLKKRLIFVEWNNSGQGNEINTHSIVFEEHAKKIEMTRVYLDNFELLYRVINEIKFTYKTSTLRRIKEQLYDLIITNDPKKQIKVVGIEDEILNDIEIVVGVGVINQFSQKGYLGLTPIEIYEDLLFDRNKFDAEQVVLQSLPTLLKQNGNSIPIYKYISKVNVDLPEKVKGEIKSEFDMLLNKTLKTKRNSTTYACLTFDSILSDCEQSKCLELIPLLKQECINIEKLGEFLRDYYINNPKFLLDELGNTANKTNFRRLAKIYDWLKYYHVYLEKDHSLK